MTKSYKLKSKHFRGIWHNDMLRAFEKPFFHKEVCFLKKTPNHKTPKTPQNLDISSPYCSIET